MCIRDSGYSNPYGLDVANLVDKDGNIKLTADQVSAIAAGKMSDGSELPAGTVACMNQTAIPLNLEGDAYKADVTPGMYLIIVNGSEAVTYLSLIHIWISFMTASAIRRHPQKAAAS